VTAAEPNSPCPCFSGRKYKRCCAPLHRGASATSPESLMRSRYAAYALALVDYIIGTTHPAGPHYEDDVLRWRNQLAEFSLKTHFEGLEVTAEEEGPLQSWVSFRANLKQGEHDASFAERSLFVRHQGRWLYHSGDRLPLRPPAAP